MRLVVVEQDELAGQVLAIAARRRGHRSLRVPTWADLPARLPFEPSACVYGIDLLEARAIEPLLAFLARFPGTVGVVASERVRDPLPLQALRRGVGDIVRKPYHPFELIERIERLEQIPLRRGPSETLRLGDVLVDLASYRAEKSGVDLKLTKLELRLLFCLLEDAGRVTPLQKLLTFAWEGDGRADASLLKTHVSHVRTKLAAAGGKPVRITSRHSMGYTIEALSTEPAANASPRA